LSRALLLRAGLFCYEQGSFALHRLAAHFHTALALLLNHVLLMLDGRTLGLER
jgi:hypothetical protein